MSDHIHTYCQPLVIALLPMSSSHFYITRMKKQLMGYNHEEPTITKHFKGHCFSNLTIIYTANLYGWETFRLKNQLCSTRNGEVGDKKSGHIYIIKILLKGQKCHLRWTSQGLMFLRENYTFIQSIIAV